MYASLARLRRISRGSKVLDAGCGAGLALRWLDPTGITYFGLDSSVATIERTRTAARRRHFTNADIIEGDIEAMPFDDGFADVALLYNTLHCVAHPERALAETVCCLKPGGLLLGSMLIRDAVPRVDRLMERDRRSRIMGPGGTADEVDAWLHSRLEDVHLGTDGALAVFGGVR